MPRLSTVPANSAAGENGIARLGLVFAGDDQRVEEIQRRRRDPHHGFAGAGRGVGNVGKFEVVGRAVTGAEQGFHGTCGWHERARPHRF